MTEYPGLPPVEPVSYPLLTASDKLPTQYHDPVPQVAETKHLLEPENDSEEENLEELAVVGRARRFGRVIKNQLKRFKRVEAVTDDIPPPVNPETPSPLAGLAKLLSEKADITTLRRANFSVDKMFEAGVGIDTMFDAGYGLREVHSLLPEWDHLMQVGFTKAYLGEKWHIDQLVILYGTQGFAKADICRALRFTVEDFMLARTTKEQYADLGINADMLITMGIDYEHLFAMHMPLEQFVEEFGATKDHIVQFNLTPHQARALSVTRGWNMVALDKLGMEDDEISAFGVGLV